MKTTVRYHSEILESTTTVKVKRTEEKIQCWWKLREVEHSHSCVIVKCAATTGLFPAILMLISKNLAFLS